MNANICPRQCDCSHPSECLFTQTQPEQPSFVVVWVVGAFVLAVAILLVALL